MRYINSRFAYLDLLTKNVNLYSASTP